jgi:hypothetical protein
MIPILTPLYVNESAPRPARSYPPRKGAVMASSRSRQKAVEPEPAFTPNLASIVLDVPVENIQPDPENPRDLTADAAGIAALRVSMLGVGQLQPIRVYVDQEAFAAMQVAQSLDPKERANVAVAQTAAAILGYGRGRGDAMKLYKLTDEKHQTYNGTQWGEGVEHTAPGTGEMCGSGWLHAYRSPEIAALMNPAHANFKNPVLWEAEGDVGIDDGTKVGCTRLKTIRIIQMPTITAEQRIEYGIRCAMEVYHEPKWTKWAERWLSGEDRSKTAAAAAYIDASASTYAAASYVASASAGASAAAYAAAYAGAAAAYAGAAAAYAGAAAAYAAVSGRKFDAVAIAARVCGVRP